MAIIGVAGNALSGKDTFAKLIQVITSDIQFPGYLSIEEIMSHTPDRGPKVKWEIRKFAGKLKEIAKVLTGIPEQMWEDQVFKESRLSSSWNMTAREFLQKLGTDAIRVGLHDDAWVTALMCDYNNKCNWIITDVRFPNEAKIIKSKGGIVVRINRPGIRVVNHHISEMSLDGWDYDYVVENNGNIKDLYHKAEDIMLSVG